MAETDVAPTRLRRAWAALDHVPDPEIPAISVCELGIVRDVVEVGDELEIVVTPTYSGCPATELIERQILDAIEAAGLGPARTRTRRAPAWSSDWITPEGRRKLQAYGIAPPGAAQTESRVPVRSIRRRAVEAPVPCPRCASTQTSLLSAFGSTACKSLHRCLRCLEPFEYFKPI
jgi:ring-1,2-phenylacetyl-CoA epoxidase subunit PaaD